ncbi:MAG: UbiD-like subunit of potential (de) carboxylase [Pseudomonadota bacterium]
MARGSNLEQMRVEALGDLRRCLELAKELDNIRIIEGADWDLEIGALYELSLEKEDPPILVFDKIKGYPAGFRVAVNVRSSQVFVTGTGLEAVQNYRKHRRKKSEPIPPKTVASGPILENVLEGKAVDTSIFPTPKWHQDDGGRYIGTECMVITKDPDSGWVNAGTYRVQVHDDRTLVPFIEPGKHGDVIRKKYWAKGEACPMVITAGQAPALGAAAASTAAPGICEFAIAGARIGRAIEVIEGKHTGVPFPADAEIAFEGFMPPPQEQTAAEGPFGEWPGYYASNTRPEPVFNVKAIYHRDDPIIVGAPPMRPVLPGFWYGTGGSAHFRSAALWDELEAAGVAGIKGVYTVPGGGPRFIRVISIEQLHAGHAKMVGMVAAGCGSSAYLGRVIVIVDDDIDITKPAEVMWAIATRWDPKTQTDIIDGCWTGYIDPMLQPSRRDSGDLTNSRIIIYAVRPWHWKEEYPKVNMVAKSYAEDVRKKWAKALDFLDD